jgi:hypothetical protein
MLTEWNDFATTSINTSATIIGFPMLDDMLDDIISIPVINKGECSVKISSLLLSKAVFILVDYL